IVSVYNAYSTGKIKLFPYEKFIREDILKLIKYIINKNKENKFNIDIKKLGTKYRMKFLDYGIDEHDVYTYLHGADYYKRPWKIKNVQKLRGKFSYDQMIEMINTYIKDKNIVIDDNFQYHYVDLFNKVNIGELVDNY